MTAFNTSLPDKHPVVYSIGPWKILTRSLVMFITYRIETVTKANIKPFVSVALSVEQGVVF